jgi:hypothetical protein
LLRRTGAQRWLTTIDGGWTVYLAYNSTMRDTYDTAARLVQLGRDSKVRRVVVDLRNNGGEIRTYPPLLGALRGR